MKRDAQKSTATWPMLNRRTLVIAPGLATLVHGLANVRAGASAQMASPEVNPVAPAGTPGATPVASTGSPAWLGTIEDLVRIETWRASDGSNEADVVERLGQIKARFAQEIDAFVGDNGLDAAAPVPFEWRDPDNPYWVFGWRAGSGANRMTLITHLDTVPPGEADWRPFEPRIEQREYNGTTTDFLVGRGALDDKGPAVVALNAFLDVLPDLEANPDLLQGVTLEVLFDTSEETDMSTPHYLTANPDAVPTFGIVFDAFWSVRAEKGIERPVFSAAVTADPDTGLWVETLATNEGPANQIADSATATISGSDPAALDVYAELVADAYAAYGFDDPGYRRAALTVSRDGADVVLTTTVAGAQHGSAPDENRAEGANPLVSLANFIAGEAAGAVLGDNHYTRIADFIAWGWGTFVFGEKHPELLLRNDEVFEAGNGTTYALTRVTTDGDSQTVQLRLDIRYATGHHERSWDGTEGLIAGGSLFGEIFDQLVNRYAATDRGSAITVATTNLFAPDLRNPDNPYLSKVNAAYRAALGVDSPMLAVGGGTDAKGQPELVAAGALFTDSLGAPVNYHGIDEGAPIMDLVNSQAILDRLLRDEAGLS